MDKHSLFTKRKLAIEDMAKLLFSEGKLGDKMQSALALQQMPGLDLFMTAVPWTIAVQQGVSIAGFSENLYFTAQDIYAQLFLLLKTAPPETIVTIGIDEKRLVRPQHVRRSPSPEGR